ncbi:MAG: radical SAM protein [Thermoplasmata archaeon]|nr:radical SAM protein [Thermoplasmata archaeon]
MQLRISIGSAIALGLRKESLDCLPTTCYLMLGEHCRGNCGFCAQARDAKGGNRLSRVLWPPLDLKTLASSLPREGIRRICFQTLDYPGMVDELEGLAAVLGTETPMSAAINPLAARELERLKEAGVERVGIGLDAASKEVFGRVKGPEVGGRYTWKRTWEAMEEAVPIFGKGRVSAHIIVGLGERDEDVVKSMTSLAAKGVHTSLFAATPLREARLDLSPPPIGRYRAMQATRELVMGGAGLEDFVFDTGGKLIALPEGWEGRGGEKPPAGGWEGLNGTMTESVEGLDGKAFMVRGCPDCNRPYYNERPGGEMYNYPFVLSPAERNSAISQILEYGVR